MKHQKNFGRKVKMHSNNNSNRTRRFMTCFSIAVSILSLSLFLFIFVLFNLYFRQVFCSSILFCSVSPFAMSQFKPKMLVAWHKHTLCTNVCGCARATQCTIKINSTSLFFNSNFICLFMLFTGVFFYCKIAIDRRIAAANPSDKRVLDWRRRRKRQENNSKYENKSKKIEMDVLRFNITAHAERQKERKPAQHRKQSDSLFGRVRGVRRLKH